MSKFVLRVEVGPHRWDAFVAQHPRGWVWHLSAWLDYLTHSGRTDGSVALVDDGEVVGVVPWCYPVPSDDPLPAPLLPPSVATPYPGPYRAEPVRSETGGDGFYTRVIDVARLRASLWRDMRRSYHALIHRAEERYRCAWVSPSVLEALYAAQSHLPSLTAEQWSDIAAIAASGRFRVLAAYDAQHECAGAIGIYLWKGRAYYGHGRSRDRNVNHLLQWRAMQWLSEQDVRWYEVGWEARPEDDAKARAVAFHKAGFGGERWWIKVTGQEGA